MLEVTLRSLSNFLAVEYHLRLRSNLNLALVSHQSLAILDILKLLAIS